MSHSRADSRSSHGGRSRLAALSRRLSRRRQHPNRHPERTASAAMTQKRSDTPLSKAQRRKVGVLNRKAEAQLKAKLTRGGPTLAITRLAAQGGEPVDRSAAAGANGRLRPR